MLVQRLVEHTFDQIELSAELLGETKHYLTPGGKVDVLFVNEKPLTIELPSTAPLSQTAGARRYPQPRLVRPFEIPHVPLHRALPVA